MKNKKYYKTMVVLLLCLLPIIGFANNDTRKPTLKKEYKFQISENNRLFKATMILNINFNLMRKNGVLDVFHDEKSSEINNILGEIPKIPKEYSNLYFYGSGEKYDINIIIEGDFDKVNILNHVENILKNKKNITEIINVKSKKYKNGKIHVFKINIKEKNSKARIKKLYLGEKDGSKFMLSFHLVDIRDWITHEIEPLYKNEMKKDDIVQFLFNPKIFLNNSDEIYNKNDELFKSSILKEISNIHMTANIKNNTFYFGALLTTVNEITAKKVSQIINGIYAINQLSNDKDKLQNIVINNAINIQKDNFIRIGSYIPLKELVKSNDQ